jgi:hypothetical protein
MSAGLVPLFTSAPRLRLHINEQAVAYAIGFNVNIAIDVQPVQVIGQFSGMSLEPTVYNVVTGTMQIIKLISGSTKVEQAALVKSEPLIGNGVTTVATKNADGTVKVEAQTSVTEVTASSKADTNSLLSQQSLFAHLDPSKVLISRSFDMDLYLTVPVAANIAATGTAPAVGQLSLNGTPARWMRIKYCRLTSRNTNIAHGQLVNEPVNFQGLMATPVLKDADLFKLDSLVSEKLG